MKSVLFFTAMLILASLESLVAQNAIWQQPETTIRLFESGELLASMRPDFIDRQAIVMIEDDQYRLDFNADAYRCKIFLNDGNTPVAIGKRLQGRQKRLEFASGDVLHMLKTGKRKAYSININNSLQLDFSAGNIEVRGNGNYSRNEILAQATLVFVYTYDRYKRGQGNDLLFIPIIIPAN